MAAEGFRLVADKLVIDVNDLIANIRRAWEN